MRGRCNLERPRRRRCPSVYARQHYLERFAEVLERAGGYGHDDAVTAAKQILPDVLWFDFSKPVTFPNGRVPTDHVIEARLAILGNGQIPSDGLKPHDDLLSEFPYLGSRWLLNAQHLRNVPGRKTDVADAAWI